MWNTKCMVPYKIMWLTKSHFNLRDIHFRKEIMHDSCREL